VVKYDQLSSLMVAESFTKSISFTTNDTDLKTKVCDGGSYGTDSCYYLNNQSNKLKVH